MSNLWRMDSPFMQKMTFITNLLILNVLWVLCSLPILTMGASTTAMYSVLFAYRRKETDSVFRPFFTAFKKGFVKSTLSWIVLLVLGIALGYDIILLIHGAEMQLFLCIPVIIVSLLVLITGVYLFPQLALFDNKLKIMIKNSFLLFMLYPIQSIAIMILTLFPWILLLCIPQLFWVTLLLWTLLGFSLLAYLNTFLLLTIFKKYIPETKPKNAQDEA